MFTGLIDHCASIQKIDSLSESDQKTIWIDSQFSDLQMGESIAVDGACLTVVEKQGHQFACELSPETLQVTIAKDYQTGCAINLEPAMRLGDRFGGHFVMGHVDAVIAVDMIRQEGLFRAIYFSGVSQSHASYLSPKGSVCVNGVSLTINDVFPGGFSVMLIPHTLSHTNLSNLKEGQGVNVEYDYLAKLVVRSTARNEE